jgi:hypothetical protein
MRNEYRGDIRDLSYDELSAKSNGQSEAEIAADARAERIAITAGFMPEHQGKPSRYYLLRHLGLEEHIDERLPA